MVNGRDTYTLNIHESSTVPDGSREELQAFVFQSPLDKREAQVWFSVPREPLSSGPLRLALGETLSFDGAEVKVAQIVRATTDPSAVPANPGPRWSIKIEGLAGRGLAWVAFDRDGVPIRAVDPAGYPVAVDPGEAIGSSFYTDVENKPERPFREARFVSPNPGMGYSFDDRWRNMTADWIYTNIDPSQIAYVQALASRRRSVVVGGIPLDPIRGRR
jgi:hypothetical protein